MKLYVDTSLQIFAETFFFHENSSTFKDLKIVVTTQLKLCNTLLLNDSNYV